MTIVIMEQKRIKVRLTENSPYSDYGYYEKGDIGYIDGYVNDNAVIILENGKFAKADLRWIEVVNEEDKNVNTELAESEDERIRKSLIDMLKNDEKCYLKEIAWLEKQGEKIEPIEGFNTEFERQISHLIASTINKEHEYTKDFVKWTSDALLNYAKHEIEKQGEQKPADKIEPKFKVGQTIIYKGTENIAPTKMTISDIANGQYWDDNCCIAPISDQDNWELVEQKPTGWSEEDEKQLQHAMLALQWYAGGTDIIDWLKSLRDRYTWKPSDEQIEALSHMIDAVEDEWACEEPVGRELLKQLKKLRGE